MKESMTIELWGELRQFDFIAYPPVRCAVMLPDGQIVPGAVFDVPIKEIERYVWYIALKDPYEGDLGEKEIQAIVIQAEGKGIIMDSFYFGGERKCLISLRTHERKESK